MLRSRLRPLLEVFAGKRILVIGDLMLDEFLWGKVSRISPEAPVPVVETVREESFPGGAANVARNLAEFTRHASVLGVTGDCPHSAKLKQLLTSEGVDVAGVQSHACYQTIVKTRVIARQQHVVRIDREKRILLQPGHAAAALEKISALLPDVDAVIVEDYGKGLLDQDFADAICDVAAR
ncbi:MAG: PfkB family carbohydrate kinase, partial [Chthoniobacteraceae bacterium]